jgi:hypothetical protein
MAARTNSSWAPRGPRSRSRPSLRIRFKCANRISIFLRSRRDLSKPSVPANDRATSRACSWISRGILRDGSFGQHCGLSAQTSQSSLLARYRSVLPSCTVPLVPSCFPRRWPDHSESRHAKRCRHPASTCRKQEYVARCLSPCFALRFVQCPEEETEPATASFPGSKTSDQTDGGTVKTLNYRYDVRCDTASVKNSCGAETTSTGPPKSHISLNTISFET